MGFAVEQHRSMAGERLLPIAMDDWLLAWIERLAAGNHAHANVHYFHLVLFLREPVTKPVQVVKSTENLGAERNI